MRHDLPRPFHVLATQNPIEQEGTYPLPEAQLDRFLVQIDVPYPSLDAERRMLFATTGAAEEQPEKVLSTTELMNAQRLTRLIPVGEQVAEAILRVVRAARPGPEADEFVNRNVAWGPSPRASQALMLGARARALLQGRLSPSLDDVMALMGPVFRHRMALNFTARADGHTIDGTIERLSEAASPEPMTQAQALTLADRAAAPVARAAAAAGGGGAHRRDGDPGRAWPQARRARRKLLAVPALQLRRFHPAHRLAQVGPLRPRVHPRE